MQQQQQQQQQQRQEDEVIRIRVVKTTGALTASFCGGLPPAIRMAQQHGTNQQQQQEQNKQLPRFLLQNNKKSRKTSAKKKDESISSTTNNNNLKVIGKDSTCLYTGTTVDSSEAQLCVGVYDKQTHQLTLVPSAMVCLQQAVINYHRDHNSNNNNKAGANVTKRTLVEDFGSVKKQRALRSQEANRVHSDNVVGSTLEQFLGDDAAAAAQQPTAETTAVELATQEWRKTFLPPFDESETVPLQVYKMQDFAGKEAWTYVCKQVAILLRNKSSSDNHKQDNKQDKSQNLPSIQQLITTLLHKHESSSTASDATTTYQLRCALLCQYLASLYLQLHKRRLIPPARDSATARFPHYFGVAIEVAHLFLERFTLTVVSAGGDGGGGGRGGGGRGGRPGHCMSKANIDKCRIHLLLLYLASSSNACKHVPMDGIARDLQLEVREATHLLRLAGCTHSKTKDGKTVVTLKAPVTFPDPAAMKKRGNKGAR